MDNISYTPYLRYDIDRVDHLQILNTYATSYVHLLFLFGTILFLYVIFNNFFKKPTTITIKGEVIDIDELAIFPATFIFLLTGFYYLGWAGVS